MDFHLSCKKKNRDTIIPIYIVSMTTLMLQVQRSIVELNSRDQVSCKPETIYYSSLQQKFFDVFSGQCWASEKFELRASMIGSPFQEVEFGNSLDNRLEAL